MLKDGDVAGGWWDVEQGWTDVEQGWTDVEQGWTDVEQGWTDVEQGWTDVERRWTDVEQGAGSQPKGGQAFTLAGGCGHDAEVMPTVLGLELDCVLDDPDAGRTAPAKLYSYEVDPPLPVLRAMLLQVLLGGGDEVVTLR